VFLIKSFLGASTSDMRHVYNLYLLSSTKFLFLFSRLLFSLSSNVICKENDYLKFVFGSSELLFLAIETIFVISISIWIYLGMCCCGFLLHHFPPFYNLLIRYHREVILSENSLHSSLRPFHLTAIISALIAIKISCGLLFTRFSSVHCS
jgi:hypothetical protein